jgi:hypothetical protein
MSISIEQLQGEITGLIRKSKSGDLDGHPIDIMRERHPKMTLGEFHIAAERAFRSLGVADEVLREMRLQHLTRVTA